MGIFGKFATIVQKDVNEYKVIELEAENDKLKDELIEQLKARIGDLEAVLRITNSSEAVYNQFAIEKAIESPTPKSRPILRTMSEVSQVLEKASLKKAENVKKIS